MLSTKTLTLAQLEYLLSSCDNRRLPKSNYPTGGSFQNTQRRKFVRSRKGRTVTYGAPRHYIDQAEADAFAEWLERDKR